MSEFIVRCYECEPVRGGPREWLWLCQECAVEHQAQHKRDAGHCEVWLSVVEEPTMERLSSMLRRVSRITGGW